MRARTTIQAVSGSYSTAILATGGSLPGTRTIERAWLRREGREPQFRLDRFALDTFRCLKELRPKTIHGISTPSFAPGLAYKLLNPSVKLVLESHGLTQLEAVSANPLYRQVSALIDSAGIRWADDLILMSHSQKKYYSEAFGRSDAGTHVIWGPVDTGPTPVTDPPPAPPFLLGYLGGGSHWQGLETILQAARLLADSKNIVVRLAGVQKTDLSGEIPPNVEVLGTIPPDRGDSFLQGCHALLSTRVGGPVAQTQYPHKLSYYLAAGRPILASDVSDQAEIVNQAECGFTFPSENPDALAQAARAVASLSPEERIKMGLSARRFAEIHLTTARLADRLGKIYEGPGKSG